MLYINHPSHLRAQMDWILLLYTHFQLKQGGQSDESVSLCIVVPNGKVDVSIA